MKQILFWKPESVSSPKVPQLHGGAFWTKASVGPPWLPMGGAGGPSMLENWFLKKKGWVFLKEKFYKRKIYSVKSSNFEEIVQKKVHFRGGGELRILKGWALKFGRGPWGNFCGKGIGHRPFKRKSRESLWLKVSSELDGQDRRTYSYG